MGWSIDNKVLLIERIFRKQKRRVKVQRPEHPYPLVHIYYEGKRLPYNVMDEVVQLFPDNICIHFVSDYIFPNESEVGKTLTTPEQLEVKVEPAGSNTTTT